MRRLLPAALLGALLGGGLVLWAFPGQRAESPPPDAPTPARAPAPETASELTRLREQLQRETARADALLARVEALEFSLGPEAGAPASHEESPSPPRPEAQAAAEDEEANSPSVRPWFNVQALEVAGWEPGEIDRIRERWEQYELAKLEIENQRARKVPGWQKLGGQSFQVAAEARQDLGDEAYEAMLYATNQPNRVVVDEVLETSPAAEAGFLPGDEFISYGGQRVFTPGAIQFLTTSGEKGAWTEVWILRGSEELRLLVPRGPLGTRLSSVVRAPYR